MQNLFITIASRSTLTQSGIAWQRPPYGSNRTVTKQMSYAKKDEIACLEFKLAYVEATVHRFSYYSTVILSKPSFFGLLAFFLITRY